MRDSRAASNGGQSSALGNASNTKQKKHMTIRAIPQTNPALITACARALAGAQSLGVTLGLAQNTATKITTDYHDYVGVPGSTTELGKRGVLNDKRDAVKAAREARRAAVAAGRKFCVGGIDRLKPHLGRVWNAAWITAEIGRAHVCTPVPSLS